ncbi:NUDIX hydrolase [Streptomyces sp. NPDC051453]|uniref:NUDIX hydrolase n=1 Tax=Streptomyces sp. NPDC051453 TaxID=3154941 RepID=UPI00344551D3
MPSKDGMPSNWLPPAEYVQTIEQATMYGCLYITDTRGFPVQMLSVCRGEEWQFPGGNTDFGENPWDTAVREFHEETGLTYEGEQRLLVSLFGARSGSWPLARVGFVFDGGMLTDEQITAIRLQPEEHTELRVAPMREWQTLMSPRTFKRLEAVHAARETGTAMFLPW